MLGLLALGASTLHLGRPLYAWPAFIGLKTSWLSREIVVFGLFALCALIYATAPWLPPVTRFLDVPMLHRFSFSELRNVLGAGVTITGLTGVFCSIMIYRDTRREFWRGAITSLKFVGTTLVLGPATILFSTSPEQSCGWPRRWMRSVAGRPSAESVAETQVYVNVTRRSHGCHHRLQETWAVVTNPNCYEPLRKI